MTSSSGYRVNKTLSGLKLVLIDREIWAISYAELSAVDNKLMLEVVLWYSQLWLSPAYKKTGESWMEMLSSTTARWPVEIGWRAWTSAFWQLMEFLLCADYLRISNIKNVIGSHSTYRTQSMEDDETES